MNFISLKLRVADFGNNYYCQIDPSYLEIFYGIYRDESKVSLFRPESGVAPITKQIKENVSGFRGSGKRRGGRKLHGVK